MAKKSKFLKAKRLKLLLQLKYLKADLDYHEDVFREALTHFRVELKKFEEKHGLSLDIKDPAPETNESAPPPQPPGSTAVTLYTGNRTSEEAQEQDIEGRSRAILDVEVKKLFKKIATQTHPDKLPIYMMPEEVRWRTNLFTKASASAEKNDWVQLYEIANELNILLPPATEDQIKMINTECEKIKQKNKRTESTFAWIVFHSEGEDETELWLKKYVMKTRNVDASQFTTK